MKKILFIEDETALQEVLGQSLTEHGYEVIRAMDGTEGLARASQDMPALILLDLIMPKQNGFEVLTALKQNDATKEIPVIVLTNLESTEDIEMSLSLGATTYLVKANYSLEEVLKKVREALHE